MEGQKRGLWGVRGKENINVLDDTTYTESDGRDQQTHTPEPKKLQNNKE
jgi:hypothetical protein